MLAFKIEDFPKLWSSKRPSKFHRFSHRLFVDFSSVFASNMGPSWEPRRSKIDVEMASKFDQFLKASWNTIFSAQEAPRREILVNTGSAWRNARVAWGGLRRGKTDVQTPRTLALEDRLWKDSEGPRINDSARRPEMGGGSLRAFRRAKLRGA